MEVDLIHRHPVDVAFRLGDFLVNRQDIQLDHGGNGQRLHNGSDVVKTSVGVRVRLSFLLSVNFHRHMGSGNAAFLAFFGRKFHARNGQAVQFRHKAFRLRQQFQQSRRQHIPRRAHAAVQIERSHFLTSMWLMRPARNPAPKPLSMFTTLTPLAQELSILSRADTPPKEAP